MVNNEDIAVNFQQGISRLGFVEDDFLFLVDTNPKALPDIEILFHLYRAKDFGATAVFLRRQLNESYKPQVYLFDKTYEHFNNRDENELATIQKKIWTSGEVPLACIVYDTDITIIDCTKHFSENETPEYLVKSLNEVGEAHRLYDKQFAVKIKSGVFWDEEENKQKFGFQNSAYDLLIKNIKFVEDRLKKELKDIPPKIISKIIVQSILIKYLEERMDKDGNKLLSKKYFQKYDNAATFGEVLRKGCFIDLMEDLNDEKTGFNGNVFKWDNGEKQQLRTLDLSVLADLLATDKRSPLLSHQPEINFLDDWRYLEFSYIPVELISRLYEEFLGYEKNENGLFYTPSHLAKLLVDECLPLKKYDTIDLKDFTILDPSCGSGIFLVVAFKRFVQIWKLQNRDKNLDTLPSPKIEDLQSILRNLYGVDKEEQAICLSSFSLSLALCDELESKKIIEELKFDDLQKENLIWSDFFDCAKIKSKKFDLIIGNPPFKRGGAFDNIWKVDNKKVIIPQKQIALKFLVESFPQLKKNGLICMIIKSSGLLYNSTSDKFKKALFSKYHILQIFDFTALARNKSLWDNGADVASAAIFVKDQKPDYSKNILHLTFRRTKGTKERIVFEIDGYDLHYVDRYSAVNNKFVWKNNLLGGGRIGTFVEKMRKLPALQRFLKDNGCIIEEGFEIGNKNKQKLSPNFIYQIPFLPTKAISEKGINYESLISIDNNLKFSKIPKEEAFYAPNLIIWESMGDHNFPIFFNEISFSFKRRLISIKSTENDIGFLRSVYQSFKQYFAFYKCYLLATSSETLTNRNNTFLLKDLKDIPFLENDEVFSEFDRKVIIDCLDYQVDFLTHGEKSKALHPIKRREFNTILKNYGAEFSRAMNSIYENDNRKFRLSDVVELKNSLIAVVFKYDSSHEEARFFKDFSELNIDGLTENVISSHLSLNRIIKLYPEKNTVIFVKPNQNRYWLSLIAYRDADACFADFSNAGF